MDEEFSPSRIELALLGELLRHEQNFPMSPILRMDDLFSRVLGQNDQFTNAILQTHIEDLEDVGLVASKEDIIEDSDMRAVKVRLTAGGVHYCVSRAYLFAEQEHGLTEDMSPDYSDLTFVLAKRFGVNQSELVSSEDRRVSLVHNQTEVANLSKKLDNIIALVSADNEFASRDATFRDEKIAKLRELKDALADPEARVDYLMFLGIQTLFWIGAAFADKPVGALADQAWSALKSIAGM